MIIGKKEKAGIIKEEEVIGALVEIYFSQAEIDAFLLEYDEADVNTPSVSSAREIARKIIAALKVVNES